MNLIKAVLFIITGIKAIPEKQFQRRQLWNQFHDLKQLQLLRTVSSSTQNRIDRKRKASVRQYQVPCRIYFFKGKNTCYYRHY